MSSFAIRVLALVTMIIDHIGYAFFPNAPWLRIIGRLSMPLFCFLVAQGYVHTRNVKRYALRFLALALISEVPYDMLFYGPVVYWGAQNVFFTLLLALLALWWVDWASERGVWLSVLGAGLLCILAVYIQSDYGFYGVLLTLVFWVFRDKKPYMALGFICAMITYMLYRNMVGSSRGWILTQAYGLLSLIPMFLYNGKKGYGGLQKLFYLIYPLHLLLFWFIKWLRVVPIR